MPIIFIGAMALLTRWAKHQGDIHHTRQSKREIEAAKLKAKKAAAAAKKSLYGRVWRVARRAKSAEAATQSALDQAKAADLLAVDAKAHAQAQKAMGDFMASPTSIPSQPRAPASLLSFPSLGQKSYTMQH